MPQSDHVRLFFALWPPDELRDQLERLRPRSGRRVAVANLHLTLLFVGNVPARYQQALQAAAAGVDAPVFDLELDRSGYWRRSGIAWVGPSRTPDALMRLHERLGWAAQQVGCEIEKREFKPHVTLARRANSQPEPLSEPLRWRVSDFVLVRSHMDAQGVRYEVIARWPLHG